MNTRRYNDWEWAIADFACARAGMCSVGIHTTYDAQTAPKLLSMVGACGILCMEDLMDTTKRGDNYDLPQVRI